MFPQSFDFVFEKICESIALNAMFWFVRLTR